MRSNWARLEIITPVFVALEKTLTISHTTIGAIYPSSVIQVSMKKLPSRKPKPLEPATNRGENQKKKERLQRTNKWQVRSSSGNL